MESIIATFLLSYTISKILIVLRGLSDFHDAWNSRDPRKPPETQRIRMEFLVHGIPFKFVGFQDVFGNSWNSMIHGIPEFRNSMIDGIPDIHGIPALRETP